EAEARLRRRVEEPVDLRVVALHDREGARRDPEDPAHAPIAELGAPGVEPLEDAARVSADRVALVAGDLAHELVELPRLDDRAAALLLAHVVAHAAALLVAPRAGARGGPG